VNAAELRDSTATRDSTAGHFEVRSTEPDAWLANLKSDVDLEAVADGILYLAITSGPARLEQVLERECSGPAREAPTFAARYVTASYIARGQINVLSAYQGVVWTRGEGAPQFATDKSTATGLRVQECWAKVNGALSKYPELQVRNGSALHLHNVAEPWVAHPDQSIEVPASETCITCGVAIHFSNGHWRDAAGKFDAVKQGQGRDNRAISVFDHEHGIEVAR